MNWIKHVFGFCLFALLGVSCAPIPTPQPTATPIPPAPTVAPIASTTQTLEFAWKIKGDPNPLAAPIGVVADTDGNVYVVDTGYNRVQKFDRNCKFVMMWGTQGKDDGQFDFGDGGVIAIDAENNLYVGDNDNYTVQKFDRNGKFLAKFGGPGAGDGQLGWIASIKIDQQFTVNILGGDNHGVQVFDRNGRFISRWGEKGFVDGKLYFESSLALDSQSNIWIAGATPFPPSPLQKFDPSDKLIQAYNPEPIENHMTQFYEIAFDRHDHLYVSDQRNRRIVKLDSSGRVLGVWGSYGSGNGQFDQMEGIFVDADGNIYVADGRNNSVQKFLQPGFQQ